MIVCHNWKPCSSFGHCSLAKNFVRHFGNTPYHGRRERDCVMSAICNLFFWLLGSGKTQWDIGGFPQNITNRPKRCHFFRINNPKLAVHWSWGPLISFFKKRTMIKVCRSSNFMVMVLAKLLTCRLIGILQHFYHGKVLVIRLSEAVIFDHVVDIDSRR